jgi:preprotein translocase subunit SecG
MYGALLAIHILVSVLLIIAVLLQSGKGADIGAVFGGAGSQALFGSAGPADFLNKATRVLVVVFMLTSLTLGYSSFKRPSQSIMDKPAVPGPAMPAPAAPAPAAPASQTPAAPALPAK